jgi:hypothetical protein
VATFTVNAQGQLTLATSTAIAIANTAVSGLGTMSTQNANSVAVTGGAIDGTTVGATTVAAGSFSTLNSSGATRLGGASGNQSLQVNSVASAVNYAQIEGSVVGNGPTISAQGSDTNIGLVLSSKGTGVVALGGSTVANSAAQFVPTASGVNYVQFTGGATGISPSFISTGSDAAVGFFLSTKGNANVNFGTNSFSNFSFVIKNVASAVNYLVTTGAATGSAPELSAQGSDTNINLKLTPKGTGAVTTAASLTATGGISGGTF